MNSLQLLLVLLSLSNTEANYCNIFSEEFQQKDVADRCNTIRKAVVAALQENHIYKYIRHEVFGINSFHRPPITIIFHYVVKINESKTSGDRHTYHEWIDGPIEDVKLDETDSVVACEKEGSCNFSIGWSSANIYTFVRPEFILSLQPAWFLNSLKFSIHEHVGFSREVTLHVTLQGKSLPPNTTAHEIWHSLEHATAKIKANDVGRTYIWKPISKTNPKKFIDIIYTMVVLTISLVSIVFLFYFIPYTKSDDFCGRYPLVWIGFAMQWLGNIALEIYHTTETYSPGIYGNMRISIMVIAQPVIDIISVILVFLCVHKCRESPEFKTAYYAVIIVFGWSLLRQLIMLLFYAFVYAAEPISVVGIVTFGVIFNIVWSYVSYGVYEKIDTSRVRKYRFLITLSYFLIDVFVYFSINAITYFAITVYITFLNSLPKSSGDDGLVLKLICAFIPPLLAAGFTFSLKRWVPKNETTPETPDPAGRERHGYQSI